MKTISRRNRKVADLIHHEVAFLLKTAVNDPRLTQIVPTYVDVSADLSHARIFYTVNKVQCDDVASALKRAVGYIRHELSTRVKLRYVPQISFRYDTSAERTQHLLSLIEIIKSK